MEEKKYNFLVDKQLEFSRTVTFTVDKYTTVRWPQTRFSNALKKVAATGCGRYKAVEYVLNLDRSISSSGLRKAD